MAKETMAQMMERLADGIPGPKWLDSSVGMVNTNNEAEKLRAGKEIREKKLREKSNG